MSDEVKTDETEEPIGRELNPRQLAFCKEYCLDLSPADAAIRAGYTENRAAAQTHAYRLLENDRIRAEIDRILTGSSRAQIPEIIAENIKLWRAIAANTEIKPSDRLKASELAGKYAAMFVDKLEIKNDGPIVIKYDDGINGNSDSKSE
jgi:hypothetical protein